jgi:hypothetical protein
VHPCYWWIVKAAEVLQAQVVEVVEVRDIAHITFCVAQVFEI